MLTSHIRVYKTLISALITIELMSPCSLILFITMFCVVFTIALTVLLYVCNSIFNIISARHLTHSTHSNRCDRQQRTALVLNLFLGTFGLDHFYAGNTVLGILKLLTLGGCGLWVAVDVCLWAFGSHYGTRGCSVRCRDSL